MKKIIPFKKQITFKTNVSEITSIALENTLHNIEQSVEGDLIINGTYKIADTSMQVDEFEYKIPINIEVDKKYQIENMTIDINDFYYELINNSTLEVNIEIILDNIIEQPEEQQRIIEANIEEIKENKPEQRENENIKEERCIEEETIEENNKYIKNIYENFKDENEEYSTYHVYIVREGDTLDTIMSKYNIAKEKLNEYNDLNELKLGDKIIIPEQNVKN